MNAVVLIIFAVLATLIGAVGSIFLKKGSKDMNMNLFKQFKNRKLVIGILLFVLSSVFYIWVLKFVDLSILYPVTSLTYVWVSLLSIKFLNEKMNTYKWIGIIIIIIGVFLITR